MATYSKIAIVETLPDPKYIPYDGYKCKSYRDTKSNWHVIHCVFDDVLPINLEIGKLYDFQYYLGEYDDEYDEFCTYLILASDDRSCFMVRWDEISPYRPYRGTDNITGLEECDAEKRFGLPISNILKFIDTWKIEGARYE